MEICRRSRSGSGSGSHPPLQHPNLMVAFSSRHLPGCMDIARQGLMEMNSSINGWSSRVIDDVDDLDRDTSNPRALPSRTTSSVVDPSEHNDNPMDRRSDKMVAGSSQTKEWKAYYIPWVWSSGHCPGCDEQRHPRSLYHRRKLRSGTPGAVLALQARSSIVANSRRCLPAARRADRPRGATAHHLYHTRQHQQHSRNKEQTREKEGKKKRKEDGKKWKWRPTHKTRARLEVNIVRSIRAFLACAGPGHGLVDRRLPLSLYLPCSRQVNLFVRQHAANPHHSHTSAVHHPLGGNFHGRICIPCMGEDSC